VRVNEGCSRGRALPQHRGRTVDKDSEVFVGLDVAKRRHAAAVAEAGRQGKCATWARLMPTRRQFARLWRDWRSGMASCICATKRDRRATGCIASLSPGAQLYCGCPVADPAPGGRPGEDQPARCGATSPSVAGGRADRGMGAGWPQGPASRCGLRRPRRMPLWVGMRHQATPPPVAACPIG